MTSVQQSKVCCSCGAQVTGSLRFKDTRGRYWCHPCDARYKAAKASGGTSVCPECGVKTALIDMVRADETYVCEGCARQAQQRASAHEAQVPRRRLTGLMAVFGVLLSAMSYMWYDYFWG